jgi:hypothetical protein
MTWFHLLILTAESTSLEQKVDALLTPLIFPTNNLIGSSHNILSTTADAAHNGCASLVLRALMQGSATRPASPLIEREEWWGDGWLINRRWLLLGD